MPTDSSILGFSNQWYEEAISSAWQMVLPDDINIRMVSAPLFLATKLEAFYGRGKNDYMASHDLEDLIAVLDGRETIVSEVKTSGKVCNYLAEEFRRLLHLDEFQDSVACHLPADGASQQRGVLYYNGCVLSETWLNGEMKR